MLSRGMRGLGYTGSLTSHSGAAQRVTVDSGQRWNLSVRAPSLHTYNIIRSYLMAFRRSQLLVITH